MKLRWWLVVLGVLVALGGWWYARAVSVVESPAVPTAQVPAVSSPRESSYVAAAPGPSADAGPGDEGLSLLRVEVTLRGAPVVGARVQRWRDEGGDPVRWAAGPVALTDARGEASGPAAEGRWLVSVTAAGHASRTVLVGHQRAAPGLAKVSLDDGRTVKGAVVEKEGGAPIAGAQVGVAPFSYQTFPMELLPVALTGPDGRFVLPSVPEGEVWLQLSAVGHAGTHQPLDRGDLELRIELGQAAWVTGHVWLPDGGPAGGARVTASGATEVVELAGETGAYSLEVEPGAWHLAATRGPWSGRRPAQVPVAAGQTRQGLDLVLSAGGRLEGVVKKVPAQRVLAGVEIIVSPHDAAGELGRLRTDARGFYAADGLPTGPVDVQVRAPGLHEVMKRGVLCRAGEVTHLDVEVPESSAVQGHVQTTAGAPVRGLQVTLEHREEPGALTDGRGDFVLQGLVPGAARLVLRHEHGPATAHPVQLVPGETARTTIVIDSTMQHLRGRVVDFQGKPVGAGLGVAAALTYEAPAATTTDAQGAFVLELPAGHYQVDAQGQGGWGNAQVDVVAGQDPPLITVALMMGPSERKCLVLDADGHPVPEAMVEVDSEHGHLLSATNAQGIANIMMEAPDARSLTATAASEGRLGSATFDGWCSRRRRRSRCACATLRRR
jgi:hypothetical protein